MRVRPTLKEPRQRPPRPREPTFQAPRVRQQSRRHQRRGKTTRKDELPGTHHHHPASPSPLTVGSETRSRSSSTLGESTYNRPLVISPLNLKQDGLLTVIENMVGRLDGSEGLISLDDISSSDIFDEMDVTPRRVHSDSIAASSLSGEGLDDLQTNSHRTVPHKVAVLSPPGLLAKKRQDKIPPNLIEDKESSEGTNLATVHKHYPPHLSTAEEEPPESAPCEVPQIGRATNVGSLVQKCSSRDSISPESQWEDTSTRLRSSRENEVQETSRDEFNAAKEPSGTFSWNTPDPDDSPDSKNPDSPETKNPDSPETKNPESQEECALINSDNDSISKREDGPVSGSRWGLLSARKKRRGYVSMDPTKSPTLTPATNCLTATPDNNRKESGGSFGQGTPSEFENDVHTKSEDLTRPVGAFSFRFRSQAKYRELVEKDSPTSSGEETSTRNEVETPKPEQEDHNRVDGFDLTLPPVPESQVLRESTAQLVPAALSVKTETSPRNNTQAFEMVLKSPLHSMNQGGATNKESKPTDNSIATVETESLDQKKSEMALTKFEACGVVCACGVEKAKGPTGKKSVKNEERASSSAQDVCAERKKEAHPVPDESTDPVEKTSSEDEEDFPPGQMESTHEPPSKDVPSKKVTRGSVNTANICRDTAHQDIVEQTNAGLTNTTVSERSTNKTTIEQDPKPFGVSLRLVDGIASVAIKDRKPERYLVQHAKVDQEGDVFYSNTEQVPPLLLYPILDSDPSNSMVVYVGEDGGVNVHEVRSAPKTTENAPSSSNSEENCVVKSEPPEALEPPESPAKEPHRNSELGTKILKFLRMPKNPIHAVLPKFATHGAHSVPSVGTNSTQSSSSKTAKDEPPTTGDTDSGPQRGGAVEKNAEHGKDTPEDKPPTKGDNDPQRQDNDLGTTPKRNADHGKDTPKNGLLQSSQAGGSVLTAENASHNPSPEAVPGRVSENATGYKTRESREASKAAVAPESKKRHKVGLGAGILRGLSKKKAKNPPGPQPTHEARNVGVECMLGGVRDPDSENPNEVICKKKSRSEWSGISKRLVATLTPKAESGEKRKLFACNDASGEENDQAREKQSEQGKERQKNHPQTSDVGNVAPHRKEGRDPKEEVSERAIDRTASPGTPSEHELASLAGSSPKDDSKGVATETKRDLKPAFKAGFRRVFNKKKVKSVQDPEPSQVARDVNVECLLSPAGAAGARDSSKLIYEEIANSGSRGSGEEKLTLSLSKKQEGKVLDLEVENGAKQATDTPMPIPSVDADSKSQRHRTSPKTEDTRAGTVIGQIAESDILGQKACPGSPEEGEVAPKEERHDSNQNPKTVLGAGIRRVFGRRKAKNRLNLQPQTPTEARNVSVECQLSSAEDAEPDDPNKVVCKERLSSRRGEISRKLVAAFTPKTESIKEEARVTLQAASVCDEDDAKSDKGGTSAQKRRPRTSLVVDVAQGTSGCQKDDATRDKGGTDIQKRPPRTFRVVDVAQSGRRKQDSTPLYEAIRTTRTQNLPHSGRKVYDPVTEKKVVSGAGSRRVSGKKAAGSPTNPCLERKAEAQDVSVECQLGGTREAEEVDNPNKVFCKEPLSLKHSDNGDMLTVLEELSENSPGRDQIAPNKDTEFFQVHEKGTDQVINMTPNFGSQNFMFFDASPRNERSEHVNEPELRKPETWCSIPSNRAVKLGVARKTGKKLKTVRKPAPGVGFRRVPDKKKSRLTPKTSAECTQESISLQCISDGGRDPGKKTSQITPKTSAESTQESLSVMCVSGGVREPVSDYPHKVIHRKKNGSENQGTKEIKVNKRLARRTADDLKILSIIEKKKRKLKEDESSSAYMKSVDKSLDTLLAVDWSLHERLLELEKGRKEKDSQASLVNTVVNMLSLNMP